MQVDLISLKGTDKSTEDPTSWPIGQTWFAQDTPSALHYQINNYLGISKADAWLFWDFSVGIPDARIVTQTLLLPGDVWHAGLRLGMRGQPKMIDFVQPTWMLNRDPNPDIQATSWRMSLRSCLIRTEVLRQLGDIDPEYDTIEGGSLEMGYRYNSGGAFIRHIPSLLPHNFHNNNVLPYVTVHDELRFIHQKFGPRWFFWSLFRATLNGYPVFSNDKGL